MGDGFPPGLPVTENVSVWHCVTAVTFTPAARLMVPPEAYPIL